MRCKYSTFLSPLYTFLPNSPGQPSFHDAERKLFAFPNRLGGLGVVDPIGYPQNQFAASVAVITPLISYLSC